LGVGVARFDQRPLNALDIRGELIATAGGAGIVGNHY
jgi:hypothetical protein